MLIRDRKEYEPLNLGWLQYLIDTGRVNDKEPITMNMLKQAGAIGKIKHGIKLLADVSSTWHVVMGNCTFVLLLTDGMPYQ